MSRPKLLLSRLILLKKTFHLYDFLLFFSQYYLMAENLNL